MVFFINKAVASSPTEHSYKKALLAVAGASVVVALVWGGIEQATRKPELKELAEGFTLEPASLAQGVTVDSPQVEVASSPVAETPAPSPQVTPQLEPTATPDPYAGMAELQITFCGSTAAPGANFRAAPNLSDSSILGVVPNGETVRLTGRQWLDAGGDRFLQAINPHALAASANGNAQTSLAQNQTGWIHDCFLH